MAVKKGTNQGAKELAQLLYTRNDLTLKDTAARVGVTEKTVGKWASVGMWDNLKKCMQITKQEQLREFYTQLQKLNQSIKNGAGFPNSKEANTQKLLACSINALENETSVAQIIDVCTDFTKWFPVETKEDMELSKTVVRLFDQFITSKMIGH